MLLRGLASRENSNLCFARSDVDFTEIFPHDQRRQKGGYTDDDKGDKYRLMLFHGSLFLDLTVCKRHSTCD